MVDAQIAANRQVFAIFKPLRNQLRLPGLGNAVQTAQHLLAEGRLGNAIGDRAVNFDIVRPQANPQAQICVACAVIVQRQLGTCLTYQA